MARLVAICVVILFLTVQCLGLPVDDDAKPCHNHLQCGAMRICDPVIKACRFVRTSAELLLRLPCRPVFKSPCQNDSDCICTTHLLVCEDNECVFNRPRVNRADVFLRRRRARLQGM